MDGRGRTKLGSLLYLLAVVNRTHLTMPSDANDKSSKERFTALLNESFANHGIIIDSISEDVFLTIRVHGRDFTVNTENICRDYLRNGDAEAVNAWVDTISAIEAPPPDWKMAQSGIRFSAEGADMNLRTALADKITNAVYRVIVWCAPEERSVRWITPDQLEVWGITKDLAVATANQNMAKLMHETPLEIHKIDNHEAGIFSTDSVFKASLIFSPNFKEKVLPTLGWPVYAVIPCRDFMYVTADRDLVRKLGEIVIREYQESGYRVTTEVLQLSDKGIIGIGEFRVTPKQ
ncbi:MAG TPA: hypothetical protein V6C97_09365 [Oculatellaceae cyanobacterium]